MDSSDLNILFDHITELKDEVDILKEENLELNGHLKEYDILIEKIHVALNDYYCFPGQHKIFKEFITELINQKKWLNR